MHTEPDAKADPKFRYHKGDYDGLNNCIQEIDWSDVLHHMNVDYAWLYFSNVYNSAMNKFIPKILPKKGQKAKTLDEQRSDGPEKEEIQLVAAVYADRGLY